MTTVLGLKKNAKFERQKGKRIKERKTRKKEN